MSADYTDADVRAVQASSAFASQPSESVVRTVLDAVVPGIVARAKAEALREAVRDIFGPHVLCAPCADHLDRRADEIESASP